GAASHQRSRPWPRRRGALRMAEMRSCVDAEWLAKHPEAITRSKASPSMKGYAAPPGTGPVGETCRTCKHYTHNRGSEGRSKPYPKCGLVKTTNGPGTDIKAKSLACEKWETRNAPF